MTGELHKNNSIHPIATDGFAFDEATMRSLIKRWLDLADSYQASRRNARAMAEVVGPGLDFASEQQAVAASKSGAAYLRYVAHNRDYCLNQAQLFQNALDDYLGIEHTNITGIGQSGSQEPQAGI
jgi:hypothetical protein